MKFFAISEYAKTGKEHMIWLGKTGSIMVRHGPKDWREETDRSTFDLAAKTTTWINGRY